MSRAVRIVVPGFPHHVTQRGNRRADVFVDDDGRWAYLGLLKKYAGARALWLRRDPLLDEEFPPSGVIEDWAGWLHEGEPDEMLAHVRRHTQSGRLFGGPAFLNRLEHLLGRPLRPKKRGRKPAHAKS
jgi:hypothetical protein